MIGSMTMRLSNVEQIPREASLLGVNARAKVRDFQAPAVFQRRRDHEDVVAFVNDGEGDAGGPRVRYVEGSGPRGFRLQPHCHLAVTKLEGADHGSSRRQVKLRAYHHVSVVTLRESTEPEFSAFDSPLRGGPGR